MTDAICFSMLNKDGAISYGENRFNPYNEDKLTVELMPIGEEELRNRLSAFDAGRSMNKLLDHLENQMVKAAENRIKAVAKAKLMAKKAEAKRILAAKREAERQAEIARKAALEKARRDKLKKDRDVVSKDILKEQDRLRAEFEYMENLRRVAFPCLSDICVESEIIKAVKNPTIDVTNAFSPNDDGRDDVWSPVVNDVKSAGIVIKKPNSETIVFKGELPNLTWNGTDEKGDIAKVGDYRFIISGIALNGQEFSQEGVVALRMNTRKASLGVPPDGFKTNSGKKVKPKPLPKVSLPDIAANAPKLGEQVEQFLEENLNYPPSLLNNKVSGQVTLKMDVNQETGSIGSIIVSSSPNDLMSKEVIRVLKLIPEALLIGSTNGMVKRQVNITFNLK
jgi:hypothetical protein